MSLGKELRGLHQRKVTAIKAGRGCRGCGERDPLLLQFHHRDPLTKKADVSRLVHGGRSWRVILAEIDKCDVLCANCHARLHGGEHRERGYRQGRG